MQKTEMMVPSKYPMHQVIIQNHGGEAQRIHSTREAKQI